MNLILTLWAMLAATGADGYPAAIPPHVALLVVQAAVAHDVDPLLAGAVLAAENRSRRYDPTTVGRYGRGGELGLYQIAPDPWTREVAERCDVRLRAGHHRYAGAPPCLWIAHAPDLRAAAENIEAAMIVLSYLRARAAGLGVDWLAQYRCAPRAYRSGALSTRCAGSVWRVREWERRLRASREHARSLIESLAPWPATQTVEVTP